MENVAFLCSMNLSMYRRQLRKVHVLQLHVLETDTSVSVIVLVWDLTQSFDQSVSIMNNRQPRHIKHL